MGRTTKRKKEEGPNLRDKPKLNRAKIIPHYKSDKLFKLQSSDFFLKSNNQILSLVITIESF